MRKLIYIDSCMRPESRTRRIAEPIVAELSKRYEVEKIVLDGADFPVVGSKIVADRSNGIVPEKYADMARRIAAADRIVIAAPFWDMSFPSALKVFVENMTLFGITFDSDDKICHGLCRAEKVMYITTRGMNISTGDVLDGATSYIKALSALWGLGDLFVVSAQNMDYSTAEQVEQKVAEATAEGLALCADF